MTPPVNPKQPGFLGRITGKKAEVTRVEKDYEALRQDAAQYAESFTVSGQNDPDEDEDAAQEKEQSDDDAQPVQVVQEEVKVDTYRQNEGEEEPTSEMTREQLEKQVIDLKLPDLATVLRQQGQ